MGELMVEASAHIETTSAPPPAPPPSTHHRRPRVREVSSRFMSPMVSSSSGDHNHSHPHSHSHSLPLKSPLHKLYSLPSPTSKSILDIQSRQRSTPNNRRRRPLDLDQPLRCSNENQPTNTGSESSVQIQGSDSSISSEDTHLSGSPRKQRSLKPYKENRGVRQTTPSRPDTPTVTTSMDKIVSVSSRFRIVQQRFLKNTACAATKLLQSTVMSSSSSTSQQPGNKVSTHENQDDSDNNIHTARSLTDFRTSMPEADMLPSVSSRLRTEKNGSRGGIGGNSNTSASTDSLKFASFSCSRSLNLTSPSCDHSPYSSIDSGERLVSSVFKPPLHFGKIGGLNLPPVPPCASSKLGLDVRKVKKVSGHLEDVHSLKLLYNRYFQWRFANARAEASIQALQRESERSIASLSLKMLELYDSVVNKRVELGILKRAKTVSAILDSQIPHLDEWYVLEKDYSLSLSETIQALTNASLRLPISGNVRADVKEINEALNSAAKVMGVIASHVQRFFPKAKETETLISELARLTGGEKALIEECGDLLSNTYTSQVDEWSLRSQIIQFQR